jgi:hypothetical protein
MIWSTMPRRACARRPQWDKAEDRCRLAMKPSRGWLSFVVSSRRREELAGRVRAAPEGKSRQAASYCEPSSASTVSASVASRSIARP